MRRLPLGTRSVLPTLMLGASVLVLLVLAPSALAALSFRFDRASARPGATVVASELGWSSAPTGVTVYLVPTRLPGVTPDPAGGYVLSGPPKRNVIKLGRPLLTRTHVLAIRFRVPQVAPGDYTTAFWCRSCAKGGDFFASTYWGEAWAGKPGTVLRIVR
jgi:hypothetical protein